MLLPQKFVYLDEVDSSITQDLRYTYNENFLGRKVPGYRSNRAILTKDAAFDLFGPASHHETDLIEEEYLTRRSYMYSVLSKHGFNRYPKEWWHYTLENEPFPDTYFDFDVR